MPTKKTKNLRNNEHNNMQNIFDSLYAQSRNNQNFYNLYEIITSDNNLKLAFENIKNNKGSLTCGVNKRTINDISRMSLKEYNIYFKTRLNNYTPQKVRKTLIPKPNGDLRPLGIPTIEDRIIQQAIKQVLEPICEAKFHNHSYGFRPNRSTENALARFSHLINNGKNYYVIDIDIKSFFENVSHSKLLKQLWTLGIRDKRIISIISKMLKCEVVNEGIKTKGTPQGGILSPLLSNIVLNELDWWLSNQWETFDTQKDYTKTRGTRIDHSHKYRALRKTKMKEIYFVRYADDIKILCKSRNQAERTLLATIDWLKQRLNLEVNLDKTSITNIKKKPTDFLGIKHTTIKSNNKYVVRSFVSDKSKKKIINETRKLIIKASKIPSNYNISRINSYIFGVQGYYNKATMVSKDFADISYITERTLYNRFKNKFSNKCIKNSIWEKYYNNYKGKTYTLNDITIYPMSYVQMKIVKGFTQQINNYTKSGRKYIHNEHKKIDKKIVNHLIKQYDKNNSILYNDNKIRVYFGQNGLCKITKVKLELNDMNLHHIIPKSMNGTDEYSNLMYITNEIHKLIHKVNITNEDISGIEKTIITKINKYRKLVGNIVIK